MKVLWLNYSLTDAVNDVRVQHMFSPGYIQSETAEEYALPANLRKALEKKGHVIRNSSAHAVIQAIYIKDGKIYAKSDPRKQGKAAGY